jgi:hypothetical protein
MLLRERASMVIELVAVIAATTLVIATRPEVRELREPAIIYVDAPIDTPPIQLRTTANINTSADATARADALYRDKHFIAAANALRVTRDHELEPLAQLYVALSNAYDLGMLPGGRVDERFEALVVARRLDLALGGAFADELVARLAIESPKAAIAYISRGALEEAQIAVETAESLGQANDNNVKAVRRYLKYHRRDR